MAAKKPIANYSGAAKELQSGDTLLGSDVLITGYASGAGTVAATDTVVAAINKLNGNDGLKQNLNLAIQANVASYTLVLADNGKTITQTLGTATNVTVPQNSSVAFPIGCSIPIVQLGAGQVTIVAGTGTTLITSTGLKLRVQNSMAFLHKIATNTWVVAGDLVA